VAGVVVVFTHNLALGVMVGVLLSALFFARKVGQFLVTTDVSRAHFWDLTAVAALDKAVIRFRRPPHGALKRHSAPLNAELHRP